jgi:hypothetical protein
MVSQNKHFAMRDRAESAIDDGAGRIDPVREAQADPSPLGTLLVVAILGTVACGLAFLNLASLI